jgi:hypothetical protein
MTVTIYEDDSFSGHYQGFSSPIEDLNEAYMTVYSDWNDEVSSIYTTEYVTVWEDAGYSGDYATLDPGFHDLNNLESYGIENDSISSLYF